MLSKIKQSFKKYPILIFLYHIFFLNFINRDWNYFEKSFLDYKLFISKKNPIKFKGLLFDRRGSNILFERNYFNYKELENCKTILDLGGFVGDTALFFSRKADKVYVFEPELEKIKIISENIKLNNLENIFYFQYAVINSNQKRLKIYSPGLDSGASLVFDYNDKNNFEIVNCIHIRNVLKKDNFDGLKIDIEGGEWSLIDYFMKNNLLNKYKVIIIELHFFKSSDYILRKDLIKYLNKKKICYTLNKHEKKTELLKIFN